MTKVRITGLVIFVSLHFVGAYFLFLRPYWRFADAFRSPPYVMLEIYEYDDAGKRTNVIKKKIQDKRQIRALWNSMEILPFKEWTFSAVPKPEEHRIRGVIEYPDIVVVNGQDWGCPIVFYGNGKTHWGPTPDDKGSWILPDLSAAFDRLAADILQEERAKGAERSQ